MRLYDGIDYQQFAKHLDIVSWDNYPAWDRGFNVNEACNVAFVHDAFRTMGDGKPFFMMESTPSLVNWHPVNKLPMPHRQELSSIQAVAHGADSVQYFQWRKSRGCHEKYHGAVVDHCGHENTRVFREVLRLGEVLEKLNDVVGCRCNSKVAVIADWQESWATEYFCGFNNEHRDYFDECIKWYKPFWKKGISVDVISMDDDFSKYDLLIALFLYMLKDGTMARIVDYVKNGGNFVTTYLSCVVDKDDFCYFGGFPGEKLKDVFSESGLKKLPEGMKNSVVYKGNDYDVLHACDILHATGADVLGEYKSDFYRGLPAVTVNNYKNSKAYYVAFRNDEDFIEVFCEDLIKELLLKNDTDLTTTK